MSWRRTPAPALAAWRRELAAGERTPTTFDPLHAAACLEMSALEHDADGIAEVAVSYRREAAHLLRAAVPAAETGNAA